MRKGERERDEQTNRQTDKQTEVKYNCNIPDSIEAGCKVARRKVIAYANYIT